MAILVLIHAPLAFRAAANDVSTLSFVCSTEFSAAFDEARRDELAMLLINTDRRAMPVSEIFWGLWLLPLGLLVVGVRVTQAESASVDQCLPGSPRILRTGCLETMIGCSRVRCRPHFEETGDFDAR